MRELTVTVLAVFFVTTLSIAAFAVDDQQNAPTAPGPVAERLVRQLSASQPQDVQQYLSGFARETYTAAMLNEWIADVRQNTGAVSRISLSDVTVGEQLAEANVMIRGKKSTTNARISLVREFGVWKVERLGSGF